MQLGNIFWEEAVQSLENELRFYYTMQTYGEKLIGNFYKHLDRYLGALSFFLEKVEPTKGGAINFRTLVLTMS